MKRYYILSGLMALIVSPIIATIGIIPGLLTAKIIDEFNDNLNIILSVISATLLLAFIWYLYSKNATLPEKASQIFMPIIISFSYYMFVWIIIFGLSDYSFFTKQFYYYMFLTIPYNFINMFLDLGLSGNYGFFPIINGALILIIILTVITTRLIKKKKIFVDKKVFVYIGIIICLSCISIFQFYERSTKILHIDYQTERIEDEVDLHYYIPFYENNLLKHLNEPADIVFTENYPILDGATAVYPVYGAIAQGLYKGLDAGTVRQYVTCSTTIEAYERLINGEIDIFFGAQPSEQQLAAAKEKGVEFILTPIAKEAFVFFVNKNNPVNSLTLEQIQDIYQKKITNWKSVGGKSEKIMPFQRPENSGSQTIMLVKVMGNKTLPPPLREEYSSGMGAIINEAATYRNYSSAIGYSFRYFATGMKPNDSIKLLAVNGIAPTVENIRNGTYPFTIDVYAVTAGSTNENTGKLMQWILSEQGQNFIEICGYVRK